MLGIHTDRAVVVLNNFGPNLSYDVTNVLLHAVEKEKVDEVLATMEKHWETHLHFHHPDIRGLVADGLLCVNPTKAMFVRICAHTLALTAEEETVA